MESIIYFVSGALLILIGYSIIADDQEYARQAELAAMEAESSPELYDPEEDEDPFAKYGKWGSLLAVAIYTFYSVRGWIVGTSGVVIAMHGGV